MEMTKNNFLNLRDKIVVIAGGTGLIGSELCKGFAEQGSTVIFTSRDEKKGEKMGLTDEQIEILQQEGVETAGGIMNFIQGLLQKAILLFDANPIAVIIGVVVIGMVTNSQGGIKLGKNFEIKM